MQYEEILNYDRDWEDIKQQIMPADMSEEAKEALMERVIVYSIITNT